jgi:hypothetical protein
VILSEWAMSLVEMYITPVKPCPPTSVPLIGPDCHRPSIMALVIVADITERLISLHGRQD